MDDERPATKKDLEELKVGLKADLEELKVGLKADLEELKVELTADVEELKVELTAEMGRMEDRLLEKMRDMQTERLRAFVPFQEGSSLRMRNLEANTSNDITAIKGRMDIVERRLMQIEHKLLLEPPSV